MANPERDLAAHIATDLSLTLGTDVFYGWVRPPEDGIPVKAIFVSTIGGPKPENYLGGAGKLRRYSHLQIRVRGEQDDPDGGIVFARQVRDSAHHAVIAGYIEVEVLISEPAPLGPDRRGYPEWSLPVEMIRND